MWTPLSWIGKGEKGAQKKPLSHTMDGRRRQQFQAVKLGMALSPSLLGSCSGVLL